jgi:hypothetical protein
MEGWRPVEDLIRWGFGHAPVVMANEAHSGLARCVRTREVGSAWSGRRTRPGSGGWRWRR